MVGDRVARGADRFPVGAIRSWSLWGLPSGLVTSLLTVEITTVALLLVGLATGPSPTLAQLGLAALLVGLSGVVTELCVRVEWLRRRIAGRLHVNLGSVWFFAAVVLLPPAWAAVTTAVIYTHLRIRNNWSKTVIHRYVFSLATTVLCALAAGVVLGSTAPGSLSLSSGPDLLAIVLAMLTFLTVNTALVAGAIAVSDPQSSMSERVGDLQQNLLEVATLCLGALLALAMLVNPLLVLFILPPMLVMHRVVLVDQLEQAVDTDGKTGLLNAAAWHRRAARALDRAARREDAAAVLVVDLDHFKQVNDTHGHLAGDRVLAAVADALRHEVRERDLVGRFGGEEFVVLLGELTGPHGDAADDGAREMLAVAERIRQRIADLRVEMPTPDGPLTVTGLSTSVGAALRPGDGAELDTLLHVADSALYAAKRAGRNTVRAGRQAPEPTERVGVRAESGPTSVGW